MKLGLIAMSGVRAHDDELTKLGLTLPGFVKRNKVIAELPSLGLLTLAGMTPDTVDVDYVELPGEVAELPGEYDAVAISSFSARIKDAYMLADLYRAEGTRVVLGGLHVTLMPEEAMQHADAVVVGEGEPAWPQVVADLLEKRLKPVYYSRNGPFDLAEAPMPRFEILDPARYNRLTVQTQRGCPFDCEFCASSVRLAPHYRVKPVEKVIAEIQRIKDIWPKPFIEFADDNTFVNKKHGRELVRAIAREGVKWFTETDVSVADDPDLVRMMRDSGCAEVLIGFESLNPDGLRGLEANSDWKARRLSGYRQAIETLQEEGIAVNGCFVLGLDGTGEESFQQIADFARECGLFDVQLTIMTAFPGTPLYNRLKRERRILRDGAWELCTLFDVNFKPEKLSVTDLRRGYRRLVEEVYGEECTTTRRRAFMGQVRKGLARRTGPAEVLS